METVSPAANASTGTGIGGCCRSSGCSHFTTVDRHDTKVPAVLVCVAKPIPADTGPRAAVAGSISALGGKTAVSINDQMAGIFGGKLGSIPRRCHRDPRISRRAGDTVCPLQSKVQRRPGGHGNGRAAAGRYIDAGNGDIVRATCHRNRVGRRCFRTGLYDGVVALIGLRGRALRIAGACDSN